MTGGIPTYSSAYLSSRSTRDTRLNPHTRPVIRVRASVGITGGAVDLSKVYATDTPRKFRKRTAPNARIRQSYDARIRPGRIAPRKSRRDGIGGNELSSMLANAQ